MSSNKRTKLGAWIASVAVVILLGALAIPSQAADKVFSFAVTQPSPLLAGATNQTLGVKVTNNTPSASINSFSVTVPAAFTVTGLPTQGPSTNSSTVPPNQAATYGQSGQTVNVQFLDPIKQGKYFTLNIPVTVTSSNLNCGSSNTITWPTNSVVAYAGSNLSGNTFANTGPTATTTITQRCLSFGQQPTSTAKNTSITPAVTVQTTPATNALSITLSVASGGSSGLSGNVASTNASGLATFSSLKLDTSGTYTLQAAATTATGWGTASSSSFTIGGIAFVQQPTDTAKGTNISPAVTVQLSPADSGKSVTLAIKTGPTGASLSNASAITNASGVATFSSLQVDKKGTYTLTASAAGYGSVDSNTFSAFDALLNDCGTPTDIGDTTITLDTTSAETCNFPASVSDDGKVITIIKPPSDPVEWSVEIAWGFPADYSDFGTTSICVGSVSACDFAQHPENYFSPHTCDVVNGNYAYPTTVGKYCVAETSSAPHHFATLDTNGTQLTELFLGLGDLVLCKTCR